MSVPGYTPYNPNRAKRASTQSVQSFIRPNRDSLVGSPTSSRAATPDVGASAAPTTSFPFSSVPAGASPFPPSSPQRVASPSRASTPVASGSGSANGNGRAQSPTPNGGAAPGLAHAFQARETGRLPYRSGFQPAGVRRDRTEELVLKRRAKSESKKLEEGRLGRRMDKLVALHFPPPLADSPVPPPQRLLSLSSISDMSGSIRNKSAKDLWRTVAGSKSEIEKAEQGIVKWQEDSDATRCPICMASFGLRTRKHHCRLCGRVVCFLPPSHPSELLAATLPSAATPTPIPKPTRRERCSTFFTYEYEGVLVDGEKKPVGVIVEVEPVEVDNSFGAVASEVNGQAAKDKDERKKVRLCRDCLNTVLRQQEQNLPPVIPNWFKLYEVLNQLQKEIEEALPEFQELLLTSQKPSVNAQHQPSASAAQALRKRLLTNLASYDTISKRIRELPLFEGSQPEGSQDRLQRAISQRGALYLGEKLAVLRTLGDLDEGSKSRKAKMKAKADKAAEEPTVKTLASLLGQESPIKAAQVGMSEETSAKLAVLLEQETLVRGYVDDANARRQFEDAASLQASLDELTDEIRRLKTAS